MSDNGILIFLVMVFAAVFLLAQGMIVPVFGESRQTRKRLKRRLNEIGAISDEGSLNSLLREKFLRELSPLERRLESLPALDNLRRTIEQAGHTTLAYRVVLLCGVLAVVAAIVAWLLTRMPLAAVAAAPVVGSMPFVKINP